VSDDAEVCVLGAGPAGAALAARLARLGHDVLIVEQHRFPRPHVGESLSPAIWPLLDVLGVRDGVASAGFERTSVARVRWRDEHEERHGQPGGLTVDRGAFDEILLRHALQAGARALPARARPPVRRDGRWEVAAGDRVVRARFLADATGRRRLRPGRFTATGPRTLALHATWRTGAPAGDAQTRIDALADGWLWGARLPGGAFRAIAFCDPQALLAEGRDRTRLYRRLLGASPVFADVAASGSIEGGVRACAATTYAAEVAVDETAIRLGEAAFAIDPLSSSGVQTAIQTALAAAAAVHTMLAAGDSQAAIAYYGEQHRHAVKRHAATAAALYAEHRTHADADFWRRRSAAPASRPTPVPAAGLAELLVRRVRLPAGARLADTPCLVGDRIELRRALAGPRLERPIAFLGGDELAPLLDLLQGAPSLAGAMHCWDERLGAGRATAIARWLHARGLLEPVAQRG
jgi:flavin-dependent dehydrogenase